MLTDAQKRHLSKILQPVSPPRELHNVYTEDQRRRLLDVVHSGAWKLFMAYPKVSNRRWTCS